MIQLNIQQALDLAVRHHDAGRLREAEGLCRKIIALRPQEPTALHVLGLIAHQAGQNDRAVDLIRRAIAINPQCAEALNSLGVVLRARGELDEAITAYRQATNVNPGFADARNNLGCALLAQGRLEESIAIFRQFIALQPNDAQGHSNLGMALEQLGDPSGAEVCYRKAIEQAGNNPIFHAKLAMLLGGSLPEPDLNALQALLANPPSQDPGLAPLHLAAAKVLDARARFDDAIAHLRAGRALYKAEAQRNGQGYDVAAHARLISRLIDTCSADFFQRTRGMGLETKRPVFVIGLPRSGTTLTEQILAAHSQVFGADELMLGQNDFLSLAGASARTLDGSVRTGLALRNLATLDRETTQQVAQRHLLQLDRINNSAARIVDKMPENYLYLGLLAVLFPQATFIHCRRDLRDVALSCWMTPFDYVFWTHDLEYITTRIEQYRRLMRHWRSVLADRWLDCDYEQTVADLPGTARRLVAWCGLEWEPACVDFHLAHRQVRTSSVTQVRQPIYSRSVGRWMHYRQALAPVLDRLTES